MPRPRRRVPRIGPRTNIHREPEGWSVAVVRRGNRIADYFGDAVYGGRAVALLAAQRVRDELLLRLGPDTRVRRQIPKGQQSRTGVVGVSLERQRVRGRVYEYFLACWVDPELGPQRRRFSIRRHGRQVARALALEARQSGVARSHAYLLERQHEEAKGRLRQAGEMPRAVKDPRRRTAMKVRSSRNRTGIVGVSVRAVCNGQTGRVYRFYRARWTETNGSDVSRVFSVTRYGERGALLRAARVRLAALKRIAAERKAR